MGFLSNLRIRYKLALVVGASSLAVVVVSVPAFTTMRAVGARSALAMRIGADKDVVAGVMPPPTISPPLVRAACDADAQHLDGPVRAEARLECEGEPMVLLLVERSAGD